MKAFMIILLLAAAVTASEAESVTENPCHTPGFVWDEEEQSCKFNPNGGGSDNAGRKRRSSGLAILNQLGRRKRHVSVPPRCVPYCAPGIVMPYPDFDDCSRFFFCVDGTYTMEWCPETSNGTLWYNPKKMQCEPGKNPDNDCLARNVYNFRV